MKRVWLLTGAVVCAFLAWPLWTLLHVGVGVLLEHGWDGEDVTIFLVLFPIAVALSVGALLLLLSGVRYQDPPPMPPQWEQPVAPLSAPWSWADPQGRGHSPPPPR